MASFSKSLCINGQDERISSQNAAFTGETDPRRDPVSGVSYDDIKQKLQNTAAFANFKPADNTKPAPGTILGRDLSPAEKEKALSRAKLQEFAA